MADAEDTTVVTELKETTPQSIVDQPMGDIPDIDMEGLKKLPMDEFQVGWWHHYRNYGCPHCQYLTIEGPVAVMFHIRDAHPDVGVGSETAEEEN